MSLARQIDPQYRELIDLRDRVELLEEQNRQLLEAMAPPTYEFPKSWKLQPQHKAMLAGFLAAKTGYLSHSAMWLILGSLERPVRNDNLLSVRICGLRKRLNPLGVAIETVWGTGYQIRREDQARIRLAMLDNEPPHPNA